MLRQLFLAVVPSVKTRRVCAALWLRKTLEVEEDVVTGWRGSKTTVEKDGCGDDDEEREGDADMTTKDAAGTERRQELFLQRHWGREVLCK